MKENKCKNHEYNYWHHSNKMTHVCLKYSKLREDKAIYLGINCEFVNKELLESDIDEYIDEGYSIPNLFVILEYHYFHTLKIKKILMNPSKNIDTKIIKDLINDIQSKNKLNIDISELKEFDSGRWYLDITT
jgi:hypothetical protein